MNRFKNIAITMVCVCTFVGGVEATELKVGVVNFKECAEKSKIGKQEQGSFETVKLQMENAVVEKEKELNEIATKLNDPDYLDGLSPESENELKHKFRALGQELNQFQSQYYQALNQANFKIVQKLNEVVGVAAKSVAAELSLDLIINDEVTFFHAKPLDISTNVIALMDKEFDVENSEIDATES